MSETHIRYTSCGPVQGKAAQPGVTAYRGIRYATAGRWEYPKPVTHWDGVYDASNFGPNAMQGGPRRSANGLPSFYEREFRLDLPYTYSEDCLCLNIYAPDDAENAPVIIYIHGGAYMGGSGWDKVFDEPVWPEYGVVAVTLNYRLGAFGAVVLPELIEEGGHAGNYNVYDQLAALQWVHDYITAFGGDPGNVTLMGQSAEARSVQMLVGSPKARGLVHRAVMSSGAGVPSRLFASMPTVEESLAFWGKWRESLGAANLAALRKLPPGAIMSGFGGMLRKYGFSAAVRYISPAYDSAAFPEPGSAPELPTGWLEIPYLCGGNTEDIVPGLAQDAGTWAAKCPRNSYAYCFSRQLPGDGYGAWHSADLWYWFGTLHRSWRPFEEADNTLRDIMVGYLINFARNGSPNGPGLPHWDCIQRAGKLMWLDKICTMAPAPDPSTQKGLML